MTRWEIIGGPREGDNAGDVVWSYEILRHGKQRTVAVENNVSSDDAVVRDDEKVGRAIATCGRSAVEAVAMEDDPPTRLYITVYGIARYLMTIPLPDSLRE